MLLAAAGEVGILIAVEVLLESLELNFSALQPLSVSSFFFSCTSRKQFTGSFSPKTTTVKKTSLNLKLGALMAICYTPLYSNLSHIFFGFFFFSSLLCKHVVTDSFTVYMLIKSISGLNITHIFPVFAPYIIVL